MDLAGEKGFLLALVAIIIAALLLLGSALVGFGLTEMKIASNLERSMQAYFLAEAGVEAALEIILERDINYRGSFTGELETGRFEVKVADYTGKGGVEIIRVESAGIAGKAREKITLEFQLAPFCPPEAVNGSMLGWFDGESGEIFPGTFESESGVIFKSSSPGKEVWLVSKELAHFTAPLMFFEGSSNSLTLRGELHLSAEVLVFRGNVYLCREEGRLRLRSSSGERLRVYFLKPALTEDGRVLLEAGAYEFPGAFTLTGKTSPQNGEPFKVLPLVPDTVRWY